MINFRPPISYFRKFRENWYLIGVYWVSKRAPRTEKSTLWQKKGQKCSLCPIVAKKGFKLSKCLVHKLISSTALGQ